jgi:PAS domain S-box-containing protein
MTIKQSTINFIAIIAFFLIALLLGSSVYFVDKTIQQHHQAVTQQIELKQLSIDLANAIEHLAEEARQFAITGNSKHLEQYWQKIEVNRTADKVLTRLQAFNLPSIEFELLKTAKQNSDILVATEIRSIRLMLEGQDILSTAMHPMLANWELSQEDRQLAPQNKIKKAQEIMFDAQYEANKQRIMGPIVEFQRLMNTRVEEEADAAQSKMHLLTEVLIGMVILTLAGIASVLWIFHTHLSIPISKHLRDLQAYNTQTFDFELIPAGTQELRLLAAAFNQQLQTNQQQLQENQRQLQKDQEIIEDVVQMSQGLAAGNLQVMPQAEYQGDFIQIKHALENVLKILRQLIENTIKISKGLAEGHFHDLEEIEYQGDFIQIKKALSSAALKLAETTTQNTEQNWLKTGQTELNETMRGEQALIPLTQNILNYLANYMNAQVGLFFIAEDERFKLVSSYAYKQRQHNYNEFQLGEGLVGQVALEKKSLLFSQAPAEHVNVSINSGIGDSLPHDILVVPLNYEQQVVGILELATARQFTPIEIELLEQVADNIAITLNSAQSRLRMQALLKESQQLTLNLQTQQQEIQESEKRIRAIVDTILDAVITVDKQGMIESFNKAAEKIFGYRKADVIGQNVKMLMPDPYHSQHDQYLVNYFNTGHGKLLGKVRELSGQRQDGSVFPVEISLAEIRIGEQYLFTGILRDITARKEAEQTLQEQREKLLTANEELTVQAEELQVQQEELRQTNDELEEHTKELERQKNEIRQKNLSLETSQLEMEQAQIALETKAKELESASQYKSEFLANMSHELRTPLNSLLILSQILADNKAKNLNDKQIEYAKTIHSAGNDLLTLINDILDLSKVEAGKMELHFEAISLLEVADTLKHKFAHVADNKGVAFQVMVADKMPQTLQTDIQRLQQILNNLLSNAFKFTHEGEVKLEINRPTDKFTFNVTDTGIGISPAKQQLVFSAFQQADGTTSRRFGGTGLGLSISQQLAHLLGGELSLVSEEGKGSTFTLSLPEQFSEAQAEQRSEEIFGKTKISTEPPPMNKTNTQPDLESPIQSVEINDDRDNLQPEDKSILIIEDDRNFSHILMEIAREKAFKCLIAENGKEGLQLAQQYQPKAMILDVGLPEMDGWTVMEKLKDNPETRHIPVHFMSASEHDMDAKKMGAIGYLLKPVGMGEISDAFQKIEQFIAKTVKKLLIVTDKKKRQQEIQALVQTDGLEIKIAETLGNARYQLQAGQFDSIIIDAEVEQQAGIKWLEQLQQDENVAQMPMILYTERELTHQEEQLLQACETHITVKAVHSPERLLDEVTLFLHQAEANLSKDKQQLLRMVHDKEALLRNKKVLLVDDDIRNSFALMTFLEGKEIDVFISENGKEALARLDEQPDIDLILMDIMMPEMDGYEAIRTIRKQSRFDKLPIIALTAKAMKGDKNKCIDAGANDYLSKPIDTEKLISLMRVWLYR